jgi:hypothetical protein
MIKSDYHEGAEGRPWKRSVGGRMNPVMVRAGSEIYQRQSKLNPHRRGPKPKSMCWKAAH